MNKDQRLIPFLGGLAIGGIGGAVFDNNRYNYTPYYYPYTYQYPPTQYYSYPYLQYNYYPQYQSSIPTVKMMPDMPSPITYTNNKRSLHDLSYVPLYFPYN